MKKLFYPLIFLLLILQPIISVTVNAETVKTDEIPSIVSFLLNIHPEYAYYGNKYDDGSYFPKAREQELLTNIEDNYLKKYPYQKLDDRDNPLGEVFHVSFAKLFLRYGGNPFDLSFTVTPLSGVVSRSQINRKNVPDLTHDEIIAAIKNHPKPWIGNLPSNNVIGLAKLYLSLGADIHFKDSYGRDVLYLSLYKYRWIGDGDYDNETYARLDEKHLSHQEKKSQEEGNIRFIKYYKTPVTYWLLDFFVRGYSAEMLDTHKLLYPRYMKRVSVEEIKKMLDNPKAHAIKTNINCNYDKDEDETALICPLTPSINMRDAMGRTPLHIAGNEGNEAVYNYLRNNGADTSIKDYRGNSPTLN